MSGSITSPLKSATLTKQSRSTVGYSNFKLRGRTKGAAFVDMGDQFIALMEGRSQPADDERHFGLVVDDRSSVRELAREAGAKMIAGDFLDFLDPWGNRIQVVEYKDLQFTKTAAVLHAMGLQHLDKTTEAMQQLAAKGIMTGS